MRRECDFLRQLWEARSGMRYAHRSNEVILEFLLNRGFDLFNLIDQALDCFA